MAALGTLEMYQALAQVLADDPEWATAGAPLDCSIVHHYGPPIDTSFFLRFDHGRLADVRALAPDDEHGADFVLSGAPEVWRRVFAKIPGTRASGFHLALSTGQLRATGPFMQEYLRHSRSWERLLDLVSLGGIVDPEQPAAVG